MVDRVEISIIEEEQPRWLSFVNGESDVAYRVGYQFAPQAMPNGKVAPNLAKRGIRGYPIIESATQFYMFNMDDPVVGGYSAGQVALRRAIGLGIDSRTIIAYALQRARHAGAGPDAAEHDRLRPDARRPSSATTTRRARRRCSTSTASSIATATAGASARTARRFSCASTPKRRRAIARSPRCSSRT